MAIAEARRASELVHRVQVEEARLTHAASLALDVLLAGAGAGVRVAVGGVVHAAGLVAVAGRAAVLAEVEVVGLTAVALLSCHARLALALALGVALQAAGPFLVAVAVEADAVLAHVEVVPAALAVGARPVAQAVQAVAAVAGPLVQVLVEVAAGGEVVAVAGFALVRVQGGGPPPRRVVVVGLAAAAVRPVRVVLAVALAPLAAVRRAHLAALGRVPVALAPGADGDVGDGVEVGLQHVRVAEVLVSERVHAVQGDPDVGRRHPFLELEGRVEEVGGATALQGGEGDVSSRQRRDVRVLRRAERARLLAGAGERALRQAVGVAARRAVELVRRPGAVLRRPLVDGEALRAGRVEHQADVGDVERLPQVQRDVDLVVGGILHRVRLPPGLVVGVVQVGEVARRELALVAAVAGAARVGAERARLHAVLAAAPVLTARVGGLHVQVEGGVLERRDASLWLVRGLVDAAGDALAVRADELLLGQDGAEGAQHCHSQTPHRPPPHAGGRSYTLHTHTHARAHTEGPPRPTPSRTVK